MSNKVMLNEELEHLQEMAVHCDRNEQNGMEIIVAETIPWEKNKSGSNHKEHNPPHAHIRWKENNKYLYSRFQIVNPNPPETIDDLKTVNNKDAPLDSIADILIEWAKNEPVRYKEKNKLGSNAAVLETDTRCCEFRIKKSCYFVGTERL